MDGRPSSQALAGRTGSGRRCRRSGDRKVTPSTQRPCSSHMRMALPSVVQLSCAGRALWRGVGHRAALGRARPVRRPGRGRAPCSGGVATRACATVGPVAACARPASGRRRRRAVELRPVAVGIGLRAGEQARGRRGGRGRGRGAGDGVRIQNRPLQAEAQRRRRSAQRSRRPRRLRGRVTNSTSRAGCPARRPATPLAMARVAGGSACPSSAWQSAPPRSGSTLPQPSASLKSPTCPVARRGSGCTSRPEATAAPTAPAQAAGRCQRRSDGGLGGRRGRAADGAARARPSGRGQARLHRELLAGGDLHPLGEDRAQVGPLDRQVVGARVEVDRRCVAASARRCGRRRRCWRPAGRRAPAHAATWPDQGRHRPLGVGARGGGARAAPRSGSARRRPGRRPCGPAPDRRCRSCAGCWGWAPGGRPPRTGPARPARSSASMSWAPLPGGRWPGISVPGPGRRPRVVAPRRSSEHRKHDEQHHGRSNHAIATRRKKRERHPSLLPRPPRQVAVASQATKFPPRRRPADRCQPLPRRQVPADFSGSGGANRPERPRGSVAQTAGPARPGRVPGTSPYVPGRRHRGRCPPW